MSDFDGETDVIYDEDQVIPQDPENCDPNYRANEAVTECINDFDSCSYT